MSGHWNVILTDAQGDTQQGQLRDAGDGYTTVTVGSTRWFYSAWQERGWRITEWVNWEQ